MLISLTSWTSCCLDTPDGISLYCAHPLNEANVALPKPLITRSDAVMSRVVVFAGTRVPVQTLLDYLEEGDTLDSFLLDFPTVSREHAIAVLELAKESVLAHANVP
ncbi:MAG: DUF433 domain-containing protein [Candidatus Rokubacteria bacterium]|nr:DUF433 domain-containing protein [Candidatus Rokubacteria bacterium]